MEYGKLIVPKAVKAVHHIITLKRLPKFTNCHTILLHSKYRYIIYPYLSAPSERVSAIAFLRVASLSMTPQVAWSTESRRQSPAVRFHRG